MQMFLLHFSKIRSVAKVQKALNEDSKRDEESREWSLPQVSLRAGRGSQRFQWRTPPGANDGVTAGRSSLHQLRRARATHFHSAQSKTNLQHNVGTSATYPSMQEVLSRV